MTRRSPGFTLIELLLVLIVIGVLAAVAIPNYSAYVTRSRIDEAMGLLGPAKLALGEACTGNYLAGADHAKLGLPPASSYATAQSVNSIAAEGVSATTAKITVNFKAFGDVKLNDTLVLSGACSPMAIAWDVDASTTIPQKYRNNLR